MREDKVLAALSAAALVAALSVLARTDVSPPAAARNFSPPRVVRAADAGMGEGARALRDGEAIDLNRATAAELTLLPRIGPTLAERIVTHRDSEGPFETVESLTAVRGVGPATVEGLRELVTIGR